jgi:hypothetical protein
MIKNRIVRAAGIRRRALVIAMGAIAPIAMLGSASPALATEHHPTGEFAPYKYCPLSITALSDCVLAETSSGEFKVGKKTVPINKTITLQGGFIVNQTTGVLEFHGAENGETLSKTALTVPGGLFGIVAPKTWPEWLQKLFNEFINNGFTGVTATTELAAPATDIGLSTENLLTEEGTALSLPVKIKLGNIFLGESCYVGSNAAPIVINFTSGTTPPITGVEALKGAAGELSFNETFTIIRLAGGRLVNNSFAAPGAEGCGGSASSLVDPLVDGILGLPSGVGTNKAILGGNLSTANAEAVRASE